MIAAKCDDFTSSDGYVRAFFDADAAEEQAGQMVVPLGLSGSVGVVYESLNKVPAMLVAGTTGSGKTAFVKTLAVEMMVHHTPQDLCLLVCDSSRVEYSFLSGSPFLGMPILKKPEQLESLVRWVSAEADRRISFRSQRAEQNYPHLFLILDDFVALKPSEGTLASLERILQLARLVKIHLILVTSISSSPQLTGGILSNTDCRAVFRVTSRADSMRVLGRAGANELGTPGEMIVRSGSTSFRCKAAYLDDAALDAQCSKMREMAADVEGDTKPDSILASYTAFNEAAGATIDDELLGEAARIVIESRLGSTASLQRRLKVGYARAGNIMDELEAKGIVGPSRGSKPREVLVDTWEETENCSVTGEDVNDRRIDEQNEHLAEKSKKSRWLSRLRLKR